MEAKISVTIEGEEGDILYAVVFIDSDDNEDTNTELWRADNEDDLCEKIKAHMKSDIDDEDDLQLQEFEENFEELWGFNILASQIGTL